MISFVVENWPSNYCRVFTWKGWGCRGLRNGRGKKCKFNQTDNRSSHEVAPSRRGEIVNWRGEVRNGSFGSDEGEGVSERERERERERKERRAGRIDWLGRVSPVSWHANAFLKRLVVLVLFNSYDHSLFDIFLWASEKLKEKEIETRTSERFFHKFLTETDTRR